MDIRLRERSRRDQVELFSDFFLDDNRRIVGRGHESDRDGAQSAA